MTLSSIVCWISFVDKLSKRTVHIVFIYLSLKKPCIMYLILNTLCRLNCSSQHIYPRLQGQVLITLHAKYALKCDKKTPHLPVLENVQTP